MRQAASPSLWLRCSLTPSATFRSVCYLVGTTLHLIMASLCIFLVTIELEHLYKCLFTLRVVSSVKSPVTVFTRFLKNALSL